MSEKILSRKTFVLKLTKFELIHLRDLFSVLLPPDAKVTLSQSLATTTNRSLIEAILWKKIAFVCDNAQIPMDDDAPDFIIAPLGPPPMNVFELSHDPDQQMTTNEVETELEMAEEDDDDTDEE